MSINSEFAPNESVANLKKKKIQHADLREVYTEKYGVSMELPGFYQETAKIVPHFPDHIVSTAFHIIPRSYTSTI